MSEIADKLDEARALIEKGWTQGDYADWDDGDARCYCVTGAIGLVTVNDIYAGDDDAPDQKPVFRDTIAAFGAVIGVQESYEVARWNDAPERTQAEAIEAFRKAADLARSEAAAVGGR